MSRRVLHYGWLLAASLVLAAALSVMMLPDWIAFARPALVLMVVCHWTLTPSRRIGLLGSWGIGLLLDVLNGSALGQHALALVLCAFIVIKLGEFIRSYRIWQQALLFLPIFVVYEFTLFWMDGLTDRSAEPLWRWAPVVSSTLLWPPLSFLLRRASRYTYGA
ncbi:MAG: rod shape-determining protein MreD [Nevskiales bacterium]